MVAPQSSDPQQPGSAPRRAAAGRHSAPAQLQALRCGFRLLDRAAPALGSRLAYWMWFRTQRFPESRREQGYRAKAQRRLCTFEGQPLATYSWGEGPVVLLGHGWNGRATQLWAFVDPLVAAGFRVVAFDMPAHGQSPGSRTDLYRMAAALAYVADLYGPLHGAIAHSLGGAALMMDLTQGLQVQRVACISPPSHTDWMVDSYADALALSDRITTGLRTRFERDYGDAVWHETSAAENAKTLTVDALLIHDRDDREVPWQQAQAINDNWPRSRLMLTSSLGHRRILRDQQVIEAVVNFLAQGNGAEVGSH